jgi:hypothetical protein
VHEVVRATIDKDYTNDRPEVALERVRKTVIGTD